MRSLTVLMLLCLPLFAQAATFTPAQQSQLCQAAASEDGLGAAVDKLIVSKRFNYKQAGSLLSLDCGKGSFLLSVLVDQKRAENLEYAVIDLGLDVDAPLVQHGGKHFSVSQYLRDVAAQKGQTASFAAGYLRNFHDPEFNPNLAMRVSMN